MALKTKPPSPLYTAALCGHLDRLLCSYRYLEQIVTYKAGARASLAWPLLFPRDPFEVTLSTGAMLLCSSFLGLKHSLLEGGGSRDFRKAKTSRLMKCPQLGRPSCRLYKQLPRRPKTSAQVSVRCAARFAVITHAGVGILVK